MRTQLTDPTALPADPLDENVAHARDFAKRLCATTHDRARCDWYHGLHPTLRALGLAATPDRHASFFATALRQAAPNDGAPRVLVAGAADTAMTWTVWRTLPAASLRIVDRCATPLALTQQAAARAQRIVEAEQVDLTMPQAGQGARADCDLAATHSLLVVIAPPHREAALRAIATRLRPGGAFVSTARIDPAASPQLAPERAAAFVQRVIAAARDAMLPLDLDALADDARRYAAEMRTWPVASAAEIEALAPRSGFRVERLDEVEIDGRVPASAAAGGVARPARYAEFVLRVL